MVGCPDHLVLFDVAVYGFKEIQMVQLWIWFIGAEQFLLFFNFHLFCESWLLMDRARWCIDRIMERDIKSMLWMQYWLSSFYLILIWCSTKIYLIMTKTVKRTFCNNCNICYFLQQISCCWKIQPCFSGKWQPRRKVPNLFEHSWCWWCGLVQLCSAMWCIW